MSQLDIINHTVLSCPVALVEAELLPVHQQQMMPRSYSWQPEISRYDYLFRRLSEGQIAQNGASHWTLNTLLITEAHDTSTALGWAILKVGAPELDKTAIFGHIELDESSRGKGLGKATYVAAQLSLPDGWSLTAGHPRTDAAEHVWESFVRDGLADTYTKGMSCSSTEMKPITHFTMHALTQA